MSSNRSRGSRTHAVEQLSSGNERNAQASHGQNYPVIPGIVGHIVHAALDRAQSNGIGDEIGLKTRLDDKQPADLLQFRHWLSQRHANGVVPPFPD